MQPLSSVNKRCEVTVNKCHHTREIMWAKIKKNMVVMVGVLSLKIYVHDVTQPSQLMKMETTVTEVRKVKNSMTEL